MVLETRASLGKLARAAAIIRRHRPSVVIDLNGGAEYQRIILTTRHGLALVQADNAIWSSIGAEETLVRANPQKTGNPTLIAVLGAGKLF